MTENKWATFSGQQLVSAYALEADTLGAFAQSAAFADLVGHFGNYEDYLRLLHSDLDYQSSLKRIISDEGIVNVALPSKELVLLFCQAQIAACTELFKGWEIPGDKLNRQGMRSLINKSTEALLNVPNVPTNMPTEQMSSAQRQILSAVNVLQNADTVRVIQITRLLGMLTTSAEDTHQLSIGVGNGYRDLYGIHMVPKVTVNDLPSKSFVFDTQDKQAAHTVLIDNDPEQGEHFQQLNSRESETVLALNQGADESLKHLREALNESQIEPRNLVACLRIDHRMIPEPERFLELLAGLIAPEADLIMTIGAGHNLAEFEGRLNCFDSLFNLLTDLGHKPVRVILHKGGSSEEKRRTPAFGQLAYTSYQIIYCKIERDRLNGTSRP